MEGLFRILMLRAHRGLLSTIEFLLACIRVHDDSQGGHHVNSFAFGSVSQILLAVCRAIAVDMLDLKLSIRCLLVCLLNEVKSKLVGLSRRSFAHIGGITR